MTISGTVAIKDNIKSNSGGESTNNVYLGYNKTIIIDSSLSEGASIGVTTSSNPSEGSPKDITGSNSADYSSYFFSDAPSYETYNDNNTVKLRVKSTLTYTVTVTNDGNGTASASPASAEEGTEITLMATPNSGYQFKEWQVVEGSVTVTDNKFTMPASNVEIKAIFEEDTPAPTTTYTVTFDANGGSGTMDAVTVTSGEYTLPKCTFTAPAGKQFKAWRVNGEEQAVGTNITVTGDITVTALWEDITYSISGSVTDTKSGNVTVKLMKGSTEIQTTTAALNGSDTNYTRAYSFSGVAPGVYNIVVTKDDITMTVLITVESADVTVGTITMPDGKKNSVLDNIGAGRYAATVGGLDTIASSVDLGSGSSVEIKLTVTAETVNNADPEQTAIKTAASGKTLEFIDLRLTKWYRA